MQMMDSAKSSTHRIKKSDEESDTHSNMQRRQYPHENQSARGTRQQTESEQQGTAAGNAGRKCPSARRPLVLEPIQRRRKSIRIDRQQRDVKV